MNHYVNELVRLLLNDVRAALADNFVGLYLHGSIALGDFNADSDIDFLVVTREAVNETEFAALYEMHARINESGWPFATELEGSYLPESFARRNDSTHRIYPRIERATGARLVYESHDADWILNRYVVREHGVTMAGPKPATLIDPITSDDLRRAVVELIRMWWRLMIDDPVKLDFTGYQAYAAVTQTRMRYTLELAEVVSKPTAAAWFIQTHPKYADLITRALRYALTPDDLPHTLELIRETADEAERIAPTLSTSASVRPTDRA